MSRMNIFLLMVTVLSALAVVTVQNQSRQYFIASDQEEKQAKKLNDDYSRLKLEQARLANLQLIQEVAKRQQLQAPSVLDTRPMVISTRERDGLEPDEVE